MKTEQYFAAIGDSCGPCFGIGLTPEAAIRDAHNYCEFADHLNTVEITKESFYKVMDGNPDMWDMVIPQILF